MKIETILCFIQLIETGLYKSMKIYLNRIYAFE